MAGREGRLTRNKVAEEVKRAFRQAIRFCRLEEHQVRMLLAPDKRAWLVTGGGKPEGWLHQVPPLSFEVLVWMTGKIDHVRIFCEATEGDPVMASVGGVLKLRYCECELAELPRVVQEVWAEREELLKLLKAGQEFGTYNCRFTWKWSSM